MIYTLLKWIKRVVRNYGEISYHIKIISTHSEHRSTTKKRNAFIQMYGVALMFILNFLHYGKVRGEIWCIGTCKRRENQGCSIAGKQMNFSMVLNSSSLIKSVNQVHILSFRTWNWESKNFLERVVLVLIKTYLNNSYRNSEKYNERGLNSHNLSQWLELLHTLRSRSIRWC